MAEPMDARAFIDLLPLPAMLVDQERFISGANGPATRLLAGPPQERAADASGRTGLTGRHYLSVLRQPAIVERIEACLEQGRRGTARFTRQLAGERQEFRLSMAPLGETGAALLIFEDITPFAEARRMRSEFVANVSHELRTPLTALQGFIETLQGPARDDPAARARFLEIMAREAGRMDRLIEDLLSLSRVEDRESQRPRGRVELCALIGEQIAALEPAAAARAVRIRTEGLAEPLEIPGDGDQLRQVFANLLDNAIKYGAEGGEVCLRLHRRDYITALRGPGVEIDITDQGEGIPAHQIGRLTERFYRIDKHRSRDMGGTGLGLAIVKHILNRHRGRLRIASEPGRGSTFSVLLPLG